jgi:hypothetical protein
MTAALWPPALADVDLAYFTYPIDEGVVRAAANYAAAVREAGCDSDRGHVHGTRPPGHPSDLGRDQWLAEEVMAWAELDVLSCASLRPSRTS